MDTFNKQPTVTNKDKKAILEPEELILDLRKETFRYMLSQPVYYFIALLGLIECFWISSMESNPGPILFYLVMPLMLYFIASRQVANNFSERFFMKRYAKNIGYTYTERGNAKDFKATFFNLGHDNLVKNIISGKNGNQTIKIFFYFYTVGSGKYSHTYENTLIENTFSGKMPHIILSKKVNLFFADNLPSFPNSQKLSLEGDFNKYFTLLVEKGFEIEACQIFTPDFMQELIETSQFLSFEFFENKLYIHKQGIIDKRLELNAMLALSRNLCTHLEPVINSINNDIEELTSKNNLSR